MEQASNKIYFRQVDLQGHDSLAKIAQRIAPGTTVLDLGCGPGALGARLASDKRCIVDGVEGNAEAAKLAAPHYGKLVVADLETEALAAHFAGRRYDYIVCADVLEHLKQPDKLVAQLPPLLAASGRILLSIPNVSYAGVVGALMNGEFEYRSEGLLDGTHLRFFTRKSLLAFIERCQLSVTEIDTVAIPINQSEFAGDRLESLPPAVLRTLLGMPDALTYQFVVEVVPARDGDRRVIVEQRVAAAAFTFLAQLFWRTSTHPFDQERSATVHGEIGVERQRLRFVLPSSASEATALRLDPSNRPGYLRLYGMSLFTADGACLWKWEPSRSLERVRSHQVQFVGADGNEGVLLICEGDDPWLELPLFAADLAPLRAGGTLEVELSWPQSADSYAVIRSLLGGGEPAGRVAELVRLNRDMRGHIRTLSTEIKELQAQLRAARAMIAEINDSLTFRLGRPLHKIMNLLRRS